MVLKNKKQHNLAGLGRQKSTAMSDPQVILDNSRLKHYTYCNYNNIADLINTDEKGYSHGGTELTLRCVVLQLLVCW